jgi:hypothetical protein
MPHRSDMKTQAGSSTTMRQRHLATMQGATVPCKICIISAGRDDHHNKPQATLGAGLNHEQYNCLPGTIQHLDETEAVQAPEEVPSGKSEREMKEDGGVFDTAESGSARRLHLRRCHLEVKQKMTRQTIPCSPNFCSAVSPVLLAIVTQ